MDPLTIFGIVQTLRKGSKAKGVLGMFGIKNTLALIGLAVVVFVAAGWQLGWYSVKSVDDGNGQHHVKIEVNQQKIVESVNLGKEKAILLLDKNKGTVTQMSSQPQQGSTVSYSIPFVPSSTAVVHLAQPPQPPVAQIQLPPLPPGPPQTPQQPADSWIFPR